VEKIVVLIAIALFELLVTTAVRWAVRKMHVVRTHERILRRLEQAKFRPPKDALTLKEIINHNIISSVDSDIISSQITKRIQEGLARWGLIRRQWDPALRTPLALEWKQFFVRLDSVLSEAVVPSLNKKYKGTNVVCFAILPFPRDKKHKPAESFQQAFEECLGSQAIHREFVTTAILERKVAPQWLIQLREAEKILVLQPMGMNDHHLEKTLELISDCSVGHTHEVITILDGSGRPMDRRSKSPPERVLVELNLSFLQ